MNHDFDERVRAADPARTAALPDHADPALLERLLATPRRPARARRRTLIAAGTAVAAVPLAAAGWALLPGQPTAAVGASGCFDAVSLRANVTVLGEPTTQHPVDRCREIWANAFGQPVPPVLQACLIGRGGEGGEGGAVGVFPAADACTRLSLQPFLGYDDATRTRIELAEAIRDRLGDCTGRADAEVIARGELAERGLTGWRIEHLTAYTAERPCAELGDVDDEPVVRFVSVWR